MSSPQFRVLTLNIHKGFALGPQRLVLDSIRQCLRESGANIVFLQEVVGMNSRHQAKLDSWPEETQLEFLADTVWTHHAYGKNAIYQHGHHGNAILSEHPFEHWDNIDASFVNYSQRGFLHGIIQGNLHLICIHLGLFERERRLQISHLIEYICENIAENEPLILAGDFNDWRKNGHRELTEKLRLTEVNEQINGRCARTYPAFYPILPMDRIYVRGFEINRCQSLAGGHWRDFSDHLALMADVVLE